MTSSGNFKHRGIAILLGLYHPICVRFDTLTLPRAVQGLLLSLIPYTYLRKLHLWSFTSLATRPRRRARQKPARSSAFFSLEKGPF